MIQYGQKKQILSQASNLRHKFNAGYKIRAFRSHNANKSTLGLQYINFLLDAVKKTFKAREMLDILHLHRYLGMFSHISSGQLGRIIE